MILGPKSRVLRLALSLVLGLVLGEGAGLAQCAPGDVLWVSEAVNANVGTAAGGGATYARCATNTVAGAAYNDPAQPFGAQAGLDCACPGAVVRYVAGAGGYGSTTASWNNRADATRALIVQGNSAGSAGWLRIEGWADAVTRCESHQQAGCPVLMDFTGNSGHGFDGTGSINLAASIMGIHITGAAGNCIDSGTSTPAGWAVMEFSECGGTNGAHSNINAVSLFSYAHDNLGLGNDVRGMAVMAEAHDNGSSGFRANSSDGVWLERALAYDNGAGGFAVSSDANIGVYLTAVRNVSSAILGATGSHQYNGYLNVIAQDNDRYGLEGYDGDALSLFGCLFVANNTLGTFDNPASPRFPQLSLANNTVDIATFAGPNNFAAGGLAKCSFTWPGSNTTGDSCPGASPVCSGGGLFIQPVR